MVVLVVRRDAGAGVVLRLLSFKASVAVTVTVVGASGYFAVQKASAGASADKGRISL
jgi:hypothetical protein